MNKILVLTATLGERESLRKTIDSVKSVGGEKVRHVLVCPESKISAIKEKYGGLDCLSEPENNKGIYGALNHGFKIYGHDFKYLTFINDDDCWLPNYKYLIEEALSGDYDIIYGRSQFVDENGKYKKSIPSSNDFRDFLPLYKHNVTLMTQQSSVFSSDLFFRLGGFDEKYSIVADTKFWIKASLEKCLKWRYINKICSEYMLQNGQLSSDNAKMKDDYDRLMSEFGGNSRNGYKELIRFRLKNINIYLSRLL